MKAEKVVLEKNREEAYKRMEKSKTHKRQVKAKLQEKIK